MTCNFEVEKKHCSYLYSTCKENPKLLLQKCNLFEKVVVVVVVNRQERRIFRSWKTNYLFSAFYREKQIYTFIYIYIYISHSYKLGIV